MSVPPYQQIQMRVSVDLEDARSGEIDGASISGGNSAAVSAQSPLTVSDRPAPFGANTYEMRPEEAGGSTDTQAGSHPFQLTTTIAFNEGFEGHSFAGKLVAGKPVAMVKDLHFNLPPGLIGNPTPFAHCPLGQFLRKKCSSQTVVGVARVFVAVPVVFRGGAVPISGAALQCGTRRRRAGALWVHA